MFSRVITDIILNIVWEVSVMKKNTFFKRSLFGGFKREDVINYIDNLKSELESAKKDAETLREENASLKSSNDALAAETDKFRSENVSLSMSLGENTLQLNEVKAKLSEAEEKIGVLERENDSIKAENETYKSKVERASEIESHVGGMIADAKIYREKLVADARNEINNISASYHTAAKAITEKIDTFADELNDLSADVSASLSSIMDSLIKMSDEIEKSKNSFADSNSLNTEEPKSASGVCGYSLNADTGEQHPQPVLGSESMQKADPGSFPAVNSSHSEMYGDFSSAFNELLGFSGNIIN